MTGISKRFWSTIILLFSFNVVASKSFSIHDIGKNKLSLAGNLTASLVKFDEVEDSGHLNWKTKLVVKEGSKVILEKYPVMENMEFSDNFFYFFVPIKSNKYVVDLDKNQDYEFAVTIDHGGNAPSTRATVYSLKGSELQIYQEAWYQMENGKEVIWKEEKAPRKCHYVAPDICEYL